MQTYQPVLNVLFVWHPNADNQCRPLAQHIYQLLHRKAGRPFARGIGIPVAYRYRNQRGGSTPRAIDPEAASHTVVFVLVEDHLVVDDDWPDYIASVSRQIKNSEGSHLLVPIALSESAYHLHPEIAQTNYVRLQEFESKKQAQWLSHHALHILARLLQNKARQTDRGIELSPLPIKLFVSHTKREDYSLRIAQALKTQIETTQLARFFDSVDIAPAYNFAEEIRGQLEHSAVIAIRSDGYTESPWCRLEVIEAKRLHRPMIVVDALKDQEDRGFPYLGNVPTLRHEPCSDSDEPEDPDSLQRIIDFTLLEVLRFVYIREHFQHLKAQGYLPQSAELLARPPEERDLHTTTVNSNPVVYPDPPLGSEEKDELDSYGVELATPSTLRGKNLENLTIGISISNPDSEQMETQGLSAEHLEVAMLEIARQCLAQGAELIYGGDLRPNGFTINLLELVRYHNKSLPGQFKKVVNCLAWPMRNTVDTAWLAANKDVIKIETTAAPQDLIDAGLIADQEIESVTPLIWARSLTEMRTQLIARCDARIVLGGRLEGYKGRYPGVVEEALMNLEASQPLFVVGGYGGAAAAVAAAIKGLPSKLWREMK